VVESFTFYRSFYLLLPVLPLYARMLEIPEGQIGLIIGFFAVSSMVIKPLAGWSADRRGRKPILLAGATLFLVSTLLYPWSRTVGALLARSSFPVMFLTAAAVAVTGAALAVSRWKTLSDRREPS
jgi:MFS family permease